MAELFGTKRPAITKHLNNIYKCEELSEESTCSILEHMGNDGKQLYSTKYYNLDAIISVGFRVNTKRGIEFRQWANRVLKDYLLKGYVINQRITTLEHQVADLTEKVNFFVRSSLPPYNKYMSTKPRPLSHYRRCGLRLWSQSERCWQEALRLHPYARDLCLGSTE